MNGTVTGAILVGGQSRRFGSNKALARFRGRRFIEREVAALARVCDEILVVGGDVRDFADLPATHVADLFPGDGPLGGLATALVEASSPTVLLLACDMPLVTEALLDALLARADEAHVVLPEGHGRIHPLCAVYSRHCLPAVHAALERGDLEMTAFHDAVRVLRIPAEELPDAPGLANVNTRDDLERLESDAGEILSPREQALELASRLRALPAEEMRRAALVEALVGLPAGQAAEVLHEILQPDAPRAARTAVAAASAVAALSGGTGLPYAFAAQVYEAACRSGYEEVRRLLLKPGAQSEPTAAEVRPDPRVAGRTLGERKWLARKSDPELIDRLLYDPDPGVLQNLLRNPRLTEREAVRIAAHRPGFPEVLRAVAQSPRFGTRERVRRALVRNPYTPADVAVNLLPFLSNRDLRESATDGALHVTVREAALAILEGRRRARRKG